MMYNKYMNKKQAKEQLKKFMGDQTLTFSIIKESNDNKWVAQCNEIDSIITCGVEYDLANMENLMQDAILTAAGIPARFSDNLLKRIWSNDISVLSRIDSLSSSTLFSSIFKLDNNHAKMGQI